MLSVYPVVGGLEEAAATVLQQRKAPRSKTQSLSWDRTPRPKGYGVVMEVLGARVAIYLIPAEEEGRCRGSCRWILYEKEYGRNPVVPFGANNYGKFVWSL